MNNKVFIVLLATCLSLTGISLYQFNLIQSFKNSNKSEETSIEREDNNFPSAIQDNLELQFQVNQLKKEIALLKDKLKDQSSFVASKSNEKNSENIEVDQKALELGFKKIEYFKRNVQAQYSVMLKEFSLSEEDEKVLKELILEGALLQDMPFKERRKERKALDEKVAGLLLDNSDSYQLYKQFESAGIDAYESIKSLEKSILRNNLSALTPDQKHQLTLAEVKSENLFDTNGFKERKPELWQSMSIDERVESEIKKKIKNALFFKERQEKIYKKKIEQAKNILSPEQYKEYLDSAKPRIISINIDTPENRARIRKRIEQEMEQGDY